MGHIFTGHLPTHGAKPSTRVGRYRRLRRGKRKRQEDDDDDDDIETDDEIDTGNISSGPDAISGAEDTARDPTSTEDKRGDARRRPAQEKFDALRPPVLPIERSYWHIDRKLPPQMTASLKRHHAMVLTTILHRCLLEGDFVRAQRAWAMILRTPGGPDLREQRNWGITAELLLRNPSSHSKEIPTAETNREEEDEEDRASDENSNAPDINTDALASPLTTEGFKAARAFYERLHLRYPTTRPLMDHERSLSKAYLAFFSVWITGTELARNAGMSKQRRDSTSDEDHANSEDADEQQQAMLREARLILEAMQSIPSVARNQAIRELEDMVTQWIKDLDDAESDDTHMTE